MSAASIQHSTLNIQHLTFASPHSSPNPLANRISQVLPILPHLMTANVRRVNDAAERLARVRRDLVPMLDIVRLYNETRTRIEDDDVRVVSGGEFPLAISESRQRRGAGCH